MVGSQLGCSSGELGTLRSSLSSGKQPVGWVGFRDKNWSGKQRLGAKEQKGLGGASRIRPAQDTPISPPRPTPPAVSPAVRPERHLVAAGGGGSGFGSWPRGYGGGGAAGALGAGRDFLRAS